MRRRRFSHYGRPSPRKVAGDPVRAVFPLIITPYRDYSYGFPPATPYKLERDPDFYTYEPGEVIYVRTGPETVEIARVVGVKAYPRYTKSTDRKREIDEYLPRWKVQFLTKKGYWSGLWKYVWPGQVFRAYHDPDSGDAVFRPDFVLEEFLDALK